MMRLVERERLLLQKSFFKWYLCGFKTGADYYTRADISGARTVYIFDQVSDYFLDLDIIFIPDFQLHKRGRASRSKISFFLE